MTRNACRTIVGVITVLLALISSAFAQVVINEVHYRPATAAVLRGEDPARLEFVELYNSGAAAVDLSGWSIGSAVEFTFPGGTLLAPDAYIVVARDPAFLKERWAAIPPGFQLFGWKSGDLSAGVVQLVDASQPQSAMVDQVAYSDKGLWPSEPSGAGPSLELLSPKLDNANPRTWRASTGVNGTPGMRNSQASDGPIVIDEIPLRGTSLGGRTEISVTFSEAVNGVVASDLVIDGMPAKSVTGSGAGPYSFTIDTPKPGQVLVTLSHGGITSLAGPAFAGDSWFFTDPGHTLMSMPDDAGGGPNSYANVPISAAPGSATSVAGIDMTITYDASKLEILAVGDVTVAGIAAGLVPPFGIAVNIATPGTLVISEYAQGPLLATPGGVVANIRFHVKSGAVYGTSSNLTFTKVSIDENAIAADIDNGVFTVNCVGAANGTACDDATVCDGRETCQSGACTEGTALDCDDHNVCTTDTCDPVDGCQYADEPVTTECGDTGTECTNQDYCNGTGGCTDNGFKSDTTACTDTTADCYDAECNGSGACAKMGGFEAVAFACGNATPESSECDAADSCDGSGVCLEHNISGNCNVAGTNECTNQDTCADGLCVDAGYKSNTTPCGSDPLLACRNQDTCNGAGACQDNGYACSVGGKVMYYRAGLADPNNTGTEPSTVPVSGLAMNLSGFATGQTSTATNGGYAFSNLFGAVTVKPAAVWTEPRATDLYAVIGGNDASAIARSAVTLITLSTNQRTAGDVTGDNTISAFDASYVARFAVNLVDHFPVASLTTPRSDWKYVPVSYVYDPITENQVAKDFAAILYGDVTGNWDPNAPPEGFASSFQAAKSAEELAADNELSALLANRRAIPATRGDNAGPAVLSMSGLAGVLRMGERRQITISLQDAEGILGLDLSLGYDASRIRIVDVQGAGLGTSFIWAKAGQGETYKIAGYGIDPLAGSGQLLTVTVEALHNGGGPNLLSVQASANEGAIPLEVRAAGRKPLLGN